MKSSTKKAAGKRREPPTMTEADERIARELELQRMKERAAQPEPEDQTSDEWRYWKIANLHLDFGSGNTDAYRRAHEEFRALLTELYHDDDFWHVTNALALLPQLIIAKQRIEETKRVEAEFNALENAEDIFKTATFKDARRIANGETLQSMDWKDEEIGDLLALMYALTYCEQAQREMILYEVVHAFMPSMDVLNKTTNSFVVGRLQADQGGAK